jgi:DNA repair photolyase
MATSPSGPLRGRGALSQPSPRFVSTARERVDDGWHAEPEPDSIATTVTAEQSRTIISRNDSPDISFDRSINPYRGCEHGCIYCYARPAHAYLDLSPGIDFETRLFYKPEAAQLLDRELRKPGYVCQPMHIGGNTDPYQPIERQLKVTRGVLETLLRFRHATTLITKGATLMLRDLDLFAEFARLNLISIAVSITSLDDSLKRTLEPRTSSPAARLKLIAELTARGIPTTVMAAPLIPFINDAELESILEAAAAAGATGAHYVMLRLPLEINGLFREWLQTHYPLKADHVMSLVQQMRGGKDYDSRWGVRQKGTGDYATLIARRFDLACRRLGLNQKHRLRLDTGAFCVPPAPGDQLALI